MRLFLIVCVSASLAGCGARVLYDGEAAGEYSTEETCDAQDVFIGSDGCYQPSAECCNDIDVAALDAYCMHYPKLPWTVPYLCASTPPALGSEGPKTDYRECVAVDRYFECDWGMSQLICCEVVD